ncbi:MAG: sugar nucleotide-binding protein [Candidatus Omnitrophica bacterium]|nr:sugar nucleotide-binding protein [Candidatus Omnitrophota bacterium]MBU0879126.1 sugar nucleotide-binding protein [Candidatus Omnitrophota bacterium]MBU1134534.1 sugar nucleotide-binding protein [Candidatus Omnitrophota bacterium]
MKVLILGKGFIGKRLQESLKCNISGRQIYSFKDAEEEIKKYNPKIIINCVGDTGKRNVDDCELDKDTTLFSNTFIPIILAEIGLRYKIKLVHISSGCIYHFDYSKCKPLKETNLPDYYDLFYSRTKIYAERALKILSDEFNILIARIRIPLDNRPHPKNTFTKLINYKKVINIPNSITYIPDFIKAIKHLIGIDAKGIYNVVNKGGLRYPELLDIYKKYVPDFNYRIIEYKELNLARTNLILSTKKLEGTGFKIRNIKEVLEECVKEYLAMNYEL